MTGTRSRGWAALCPALLVAVYRSFVEKRFDESLRLQRLLDELISQLPPFPTPWGIRVGLAARGIDTGPLPLPLTAARRRQIAEFREWFPAWLLRTGLVDRPTSAANLTPR